MANEEIQLKTSAKTRCDEQDACYPGPMRGMSWCSDSVDRYLFSSSTRCLCVLAPPSRRSRSSSCKGKKSVRTVDRQVDDSPEIVSTDFVGSRRAGVVDGLATIVNGSSLVLYVWYDNEFGYSCQVVRVLARMADIAMPQFPAERVAVGTASIPG